MKRALLTFALLAAPAAASAHDTWLAATSAPARTGEPVEFAVTSGTAFPALEQGPQADRVRSATASSGLLIVRDRAPDRLRLRLVDAAPGLQVAAVSLKPYTFTLTPSEVAHYLDEIGASPELKAAAAADPAFRETYTKHAKAMICVVRCTPSPAALRPVGTPLEIVVIPGADRAVVLRDGRPLAGQAVAVQAAGADRRMLTTDAEGGITLPADARGPVLLSAVRLVRPARPGAPWTSDFATLTFTR